MRRNAAAVMMIAALGGCVSYQSGPETGGGPIVPHWGKVNGPPTVPGLKGPHGEDVGMAAPYDAAPPVSPYQARQMMSQGIPLGAMQMNNPAAYGYPPSGALPGMAPGGSMPMTAVPRGPMFSPPGVPFAPGVPAGPNIGPGGPSFMPGMTPGMPGGMMPSGMTPTGGVMPANMPMGGGVINANIPPGRMPPGSVMQTQMVQANPANGIRFLGQRTQIRFTQPSGMKISWFTQGPDGKPAFSTTPLEAPGRYNFPQAAIYRLKLSHIEGRPGLEVYPTMEVVPCNPKTEAFLAHSAVPIAFTNEDFKQIAEGNYLVKVIYLPDPQFQDAAGTGTDEILSTVLGPGADPIQEALRRGSILVVLRMGNVDQEAPNSPPLNAPSPNMAAAPPAAQPMVPPGYGLTPPPGFQMPFWGMPPNTPMTGPMGPAPTGMPFPGAAHGLANQTQGMPAPGPFNLSGTPMPGNAGPSPFMPAPPAVPTGMPGGTGVSAPPMPVAPGTSSTAKYQNMSTTVGPQSQGSSRQGVSAPVNQPGNSGPAFPPTPGTIQSPANPMGPAN